MLANTRSLPEAYVGTGHNKKSNETRKTKRFIEKAFLGEDEFQKIIDSETRATSHIHEQSGRTMFLEFPGHQSSHGSATKDCGNNECIFYHTDFLH